MKSKMENVKLIKVCCDTSIEYLNYQGWHFEGIAIYKIGMKKYKCNRKYNVKEQISNKCRNARTTKQIIDLFLIIYYLN